MRWVWWGQRDREEELEEELDVHPLARRLRGEDRVPINGEEDVVGHVDIQGVRGTERVTADIDLHAGGFPRHQIGALIRREHRVRGGGLEGVAAGDRGAERDRSSKGIVGTEQDLSDSPGEVEGDGNGFHAVA